MMKAEKSEETAADLPENGRRRRTKVGGEWGGGGEKKWRKRGKKKTVRQQLVFIAEEAGRGPSQSVFLSLIQFQTNTSEIQM